MGTELARLDVFPAARYYVGRPPRVVRYRRRDLNNAPGGGRPAAGAEGEPPLPSLARQAGGFARSAVAVAKSGFRKASPGEVARRLAVCGGCDHLRRSDWRCGKMSGCGCKVREKARWAAAECPLGKWKREAPDAGA